MPNACLTNSVRAASIFHFHEPSPLTPSLSSSQEPPSSTPQPQPASQQPSQPSPSTRAPNPPSPPVHSPVTPASPAQRPPMRPWQPQHPSPGPLVYLRADYSIPTKRFCRMFPAARDSSAASRDTTTMRKPLGERDGALRRRLLRVERALRTVRGRCHRREKRRWIERCARLLLRA